MKSVAKAQLLPHIGRTAAFFPEISDRSGVFPLGEPPPVWARDHGVVLILRNRKFENGLKKDVYVCGGEEILSAGDEADFFKGIVDHHSEVIAGFDVFSCEHDVAYEVLFRDLRTMLKITPGEPLATELKGPVGVESESIGSSLLNLLLAALFRQGATGSRIGIEGRPVGS